MRVIKFNYLRAAQLCLLLFLFPVFYFQSDRLQRFQKPQKEPYTGQRYIRYVCVNSCGGFGDRWKGMVAVYSQALRTNRTFLIQWPASRGAGLRDIFQSELLMNEAPSVCQRNNFRSRKSRNRVQRIMDLQMIRNGQFDHHPDACLNIQANRIPDWMSEEERNQLSLKLWIMLRPKEIFQKYLDTLPKIINGCYQLRVGRAGHFKESHSFNDEATIHVLYKKIFDKVKDQIYVDGPKKKLLFHMWTDSKKWRERFQKDIEDMGSNIFDVKGELEHIDKKRRVTISGLMRTVGEFSLISSCDDIVWQTGFIKSGLFLQKNNSTVEKLEKKICNGC